METKSYSGVADADDVLGAPIQFWRLGDELYHRNVDTGRVFRIIINAAGMAASLSNEHDEERGEVVRDPGVAIDEVRLAAIGADVAGASRFEEVPPGRLSDPEANPIPLIERQLDPAVADEILEIADEIDLHCTEFPLPVPVPATVEPVLPLEDEFVLAVVVARPGLTAKVVAETLVRRGCQANTTDVGTCLAKLKRDGKVASSRHGARSSGLNWTATDRGGDEYRKKIRPALLALAAAA